MEKKTDPENFYSLIPDYAALQELEERYYHKPTMEETRKFLNFWQEMYNLWRQKNSPFDLGYVEEKIKVRKALIEKFGFRT